jgi:hypothetical protein
MLQIRDPKIINQIERLSEHYRSNIANRYLRPALLQLPLDKLSWDLIEVLTEKLEQFRYQGFMLDDLYRQIAATARFIALVRRELVPGLRNRLSGGSISGSDKVIRDMAINNFSSNLQVFADLLYELYISLVELDKIDAKGYKPLYAQMPELVGIGSLLVGS